ncbi:MAG: hypothetical protein ACI8XZ_004918, partial [Gammaproteobacteria bacterium]
SQLDVRLRRLSEFSFCFVNYPFIAAKDPQPKRDLMIPMYIDNKPCVGSQLNVR